MVLQQLLKYEEQILEKHKVDIVKWLMTNLNHYVKENGCDPKKIIISRETFAKLETEMFDRGGYIYSNPLDTKKETTFRGIKILGSHTMKKRREIRFLDF